jgi:4-alpha-glucanotransferase
MNSLQSIRLLRSLALLYGVQTAYYGVAHRRFTASAEGLLAVLPALGAPVSSINDVPAALRERVIFLKRRMLEPVIVARDAGSPVISMTLPAEIGDATCECHLELESGEKTSWQWPAADLPVSEVAEVEGQRFITMKLTLPRKLSLGYHRFTLEVKGRTAPTMIIAAPRRAFSPPGADSRGWGVFLPLYALKTASDWGGGDYSGLGALMAWTAARGGNVVGTLPLLPVFLDRPCDPSPYAPVSRLLWNEFYIDVTQVPEFLSCAPAQGMVRSGDIAMEIEKMRGQALVDYAGVMSLKRRVMAVMCRNLLEKGGARLEAFRRFREENPVVADYARFRAVMEKQRQPWQAWSEHLRDGDWRQGDFDGEIENYYLYAQWLAHGQVRQIAANAREKGIKLYFDLPLGVHPDGYDAWRYRDIFVKGVSAGAPPDPVFTHGQDWGFLPFHPEKIREHGYHYVREYLHHNLQYADILRLDHVMGLHRLYWVPRGIEAAQGVYVRYHAEELYAILALESQRSRSVIVGEDLGIVPGYVRPAMARHGLHRMYILFYELADNAARTPRPVPRKCIAGLNTHDMPPFAAFWQGADMAESVRLGLLNKKEVRAEKRSRQAIKKALVDFLQKNGFLNQADAGTRAVLQACLAFLSATAARTILVNLEDLWLETKAQNMPGVGGRFPSFQRRALYALEEFCRMSEINDILSEMDKLRRRTGAK